MMNLNKPVIAAAVIILVLGLSGGGYYFYNQAQSSKNQAPVNAQDEVKKLVAEVGKLIELPVGEDPQVATVTDIEKLREQSFFQKAKNGDKVLIYTSAKKVILYDPVAKKVIDIAPLNIGSSSAQIVSPTPSPKPTAKPTPKPSVKP